MEQDLEDMKKGNTGDLDKAKREEVEALRQRIKQLEISEQEWRENVSLCLKSESALKYRIKELQLSEKNLLEEIKQLKMNLCHVETTIERVKSRVQNLQAEFADLVQQQERAEVKHKGRLQRLQDCLRIKEDEVKRQSEYFEHYKQNQQQQMATLRKREAGLQSHTGRLEKEVRDLKAAISLLAGELQEETLQYLQDEMEAAFSRPEGSLLPSSRMETAELKLLVEEVQQHIGSYLEVLKHQLKSSLGGRRSPEMGTQGSECYGGQGDGCSMNKKSCSLAYPLKPTEVNHNMQEKMPRVRNNPLKQELLPKEAKRNQVTTGTENAETEANSGLNALLKMKWEKVVVPARSVDSQTLCPWQPAKDSCVLANGETSEWNFSKEGLLEGFLIKYLKCSSNTLVVISEELSPTDMEKAAGDANTADALRNICLLLACAPVSPGGGTKQLCGGGSLPLLKQVAADTSRKPMLVPAAPLPLPGYPSHKVSEIRSSSPDTISEADGGSISGKDSETEKEKMIENASLKLQDDRPKICAPNKEKVGWVDIRGERSLAEEGHCVKYELGNTPGKLEKKTGKDLKAKFPVSRCIPEEVSQVLDEMIHSKPEKSTCCAGMKGEGCKPISNARGKEVSPKHTELQTEQGGAFEDDTGRSLGKMAISNGKEKVPKAERLEQVSLLLLRSDCQKEDREMEREGSAHSSEEQNSSQGPTAEQEVASAELESSKGDVCPLDIVSPKQDRNQCLCKELSQTKTVNMYSQKISALVQENGWQLCMLQDKNHRYSLKICALEEEIDMCYQYIVAVDETHVTPFQKGLSADKMCSDGSLKKEVSGESQGALRTLWGKGSKNLPKKTFSASVKQGDGRSGQPGSSLESKEATSLEERKVRYFQLLSCLKDERNNLLKEVAQYVQDEDKCLEQKCKLEEEGEINWQRLCLLEGEKQSLLRRLCEVKGEHQKCATFISGLDEYRNMWFQAMFELEEEKFVLRNSMEITQKETCLRCLESQNIIDNLKLEHEKLVTTMMVQGIDSEEQIQNGMLITRRGVQGVKQENEILRLDPDIEKAFPETSKAEKATQITEFSHCPVEDTNFEGKRGSCQESKADNHFIHLLNPVKMLVPLDSQNSFITGQLIEMNKQISADKSIDETENQVPNPGSSLCCAKQPGHVGTQEMSGKETISGSTRTLEEQLEKANKELKIQEEKLDKAKKDAQKWYVELGFAETRYEEASTQLKDALSELRRFKEAKEDSPSKTPCSSPNKPQELVKEKLLIQKLEQQVLTFKAQLRDHGDLHYQCEALKKEVELLQMQIKEKNEELHRRQLEKKLVAAPFKAKLACLVKKCHQRNCMIAQLVQKLGQRGITESAEEAEELVHDAVLSEYTSAFASECKQEFQFVSPPFGPPRDPDMSHPGPNEDSEPGPAAVFPEAGGSCSARSPSIEGSALLSKLTSPEKIIDFHREPRKSHCPDDQMDALNQETATCLFSNGQRLQGVTSVMLPVVSERRCVSGVSDPDNFSLMKRQEQLLQRGDVFKNQMGNLHTEAFDQGMKLKNGLMNNTWISREKPGGLASVAAAKSHLSDTVSSRSKRPSPLGEKTAALKRGNPMEITQGKNTRGGKAECCRLHRSCVA